MNNTSPRSFFCILIIISLGLLTVRCNSNDAEKKAPEDKMVSGVEIKKPVPAQPSFLFISDIHLDNTNATTVYNEDTGMDLWTKFLAKTDSVLAAPNSPIFILYTGDLPAHYGTNYLKPGERAAHNSNMADVLTGLRDLATRYDKPLFYLPGNNDAVAGDYYPFAYRKNYTPFTLIDETTNPYPALNTNQGTSTPPCVISQPDTGMGYYSASPVKGIRLIAMNTVMYTKNFFSNAKSIGLNPFSYADAQLSWLSAELAQARALHEKVYIAMHVPPGTNLHPISPMWTTDVSGSKGNMTYLNQFLTIVNQYKDNCIEAVLYGHTHMEELRRLKYSDGTVTAIAISCPGISPNHENNPGFKTVTYDSASKALLDFTTYYTPLDNNWSYWGNQTYTFSSEFNTNPSGQTMLQQLSAMSLSTITSNLQDIYKVKSNTAPDKIRNAIEVNFNP